MEHNNDPKANADENEKAIMAEMEKLFNEMGSDPQIVAEMERLDNNAAKAALLKEAALDGLPLNPVEEGLLLTYIGELSKDDAAQAIDLAYRCAAARLLKQDTLTGEEAEASEKIMDMFMAYIVIGNAIRYERGYITIEEGGLPIADAVVLMEAYCDGLLACQWDLDVSHVEGDPTKVVATTSLRFIRAEDIEGGAK